MPLQAPLSWAQVAALALAGGFPPGDAVIAVSITEPESARIANNVQQGQPYATTGWGLWQITPGDSEPQFGIDDAMLDGLNNARAAHAKWKAAGGFSPWTTYENGLNNPFMGLAKAAVEAVANLSAAQLQRLIDLARAGDGLAHWTPDETFRRIDRQLRRLLLQTSREMVGQRMTLQRIGKPGWLP